VASSIEKITSYLWNRLKTVEDFRCDLLIVGRIDRFSGVLQKVNGRPTLKMSLFLKENRSPLTDA